MRTIDDFRKIDAHIHLNSDRNELLELANSYNFDLLSINTEVPEFPSIDQQKQLVLDKQDEFKNGKLHFATTISTEDIFEDNWSSKAIDKIKKDIAEVLAELSFGKILECPLKNLVDLS